MKTLALRTSAIVLVITSLSACAPAATSLPPGEYEKTTTSTDANGTTTKRTSSTDVSVDADGKKRAVVESKTTKDPRGLFNKSTTSSKQVVEEK